MKTGVWGHGETYYRSEEFRADESWANIIDIMGTGDMGVELLEKAVPSMLRAARSLLKTNLSLNRIRVAVERALAAVE